MIEILTLPLLLPPGTELVPQGLNVSEELEVMEPGEENLHPRNGKQRYKRKKWERERDLGLVRGLMLLRRSMEEIIDQLSSRHDVDYVLARQQVQIDIREVKNRMALDLRSHDPLTAKAEELDRLAYIERAAIDQYERSQRDEESASQTKVTLGGGGDEMPAKFIQTQSKKRRDGDVQLLKVMLEISKSRTQMLSLHEPIKISAEEMSEAEMESAIQMEKIYLEELKEEAREEVRREMEAKAAIEVQGEEKTTDAAEEP